MSIYSTDCDLFEYVSNYRFKEKNIRFCYFNARSLKNKFQDVLDLIHEVSEVDVVLVTEIWSDEGDAQYFNIDGYHLFHTDRIGSRGGGLALYIKVNIVANIKLQFPTFTHDILHATLNKGAINLDIILVYNSSRSNLPMVLRDLEVTLQRASRRCAVVFGDFNVNLLLEDTLSADLMELISAYNFKWINKDPTRVNDSSSTCIDHVYVNQLNYNY